MLTIIDQRRDCLISEVLIHVYGILWLFLPILSLIPWPSKPFLEQDWVVQFPFCDNFQIILCLFRYYFIISDVFLTGKWATDPAFRVDYPKPHPTDLYHRGGRPVTETKRGRGQYGLYGTYNIYGNDHLYPYSNAMTGANHRRPVYSVYGPLLKDKYCGLNYQHNRHGNMNFDNHY